MSDEVEEEIPNTDEEAPQGPSWEHRQFALNEHMKQVLRATSKATEAEIAKLRKKLAKIQYGG